MVEYRERLLLAMNKAGVSVSGLAKSLGMSYQGVKRALEGKTKAFDAEHNARASRYLGVNSYWLATGEESMLDPDQLSDIPNRFSESSKKQTPEANSEWPFEDITPAQYATLSERQKGVIEGFALSKIRDQASSKDARAA